MQAVIQDLGLKWGFAINQTQFVFFSFWNKPHALCCDFHSMLFSDIKKQNLGLDGATDNSGTATLTIEKAISLKDNKSIHS
ncbi:hypothetical protein VP01_405g6 [Puccinia sorghi]|uniref:Uncharacterized protein n=1 Tax=Puccinia sorghi TaxID=27349 RepID=A0A0L6URK6_9BASI|nr:hypothetical protein VP01_405g6 [Puccinia sorghi]